MEIALDGISAVITGGGSGIGAAVARRFLDEGAKVAIWDLGEPEPVPGTLFVPTDVTRVESVDASTSRVLETHGSIDVLVNCAGIAGPHGSIETIPVEEWRRTVEVNLTGTFLACRAVLPCMLATGRGSIINFASGAASDYARGAAAYNASKAGVITLTKTMATDLHGSGVRVNAVCPGQVATALTRSLAATELPDADASARAHLDEVREALAKGDMAEPEEVVDLVIYLASGPGERLNGQFIRMAAKQFPTVQQ